MRKLTKNELKAQSSVAFLGELKTCSLTNYLNAFSFTHINLAISVQYFKFNKNRAYQWP